MGLRDIVLLITIYGSIPFILRKPFLGVLVWYWLSLMNPHLISWTLTRQPFAQIIALAMLGSLLISRTEKKQIPATPITITLAVFWFWMLVTTIFSFYPQLAWGQWDKVWKIFLTTYRRDYRGELEGTHPRANRPLRRFPSVSTALKVVFLPY